jgi:hypothetical protein
MGRKSRAMELVLDNYRGGDVKEIKVNNRREYGNIVQQYMLEHPDNFITVRGKDKSYVIEFGDGELYEVYEANLSNRVSMSLIEAIDYIFDHAQSRLI